MGKSFRNNARKLKALGLIDYDLRKTLSPAQKGQVTKLAKKYSGIVDHKDDFVIRTVSTKTARMADETGFQVFTSKKTGRKKVVVKSKDAKSVRITPEKIIRRFQNYKETTHLVRKKDILSTLEFYADKYEREYGEDYAEYGEHGKFFSVKIGESEAWKVFRSPRDLMNYISSWQPKDVLDPKSRHYQDEKYRDQLIKQMGLVERDE